MMLRNDQKRRLSSPSTMQSQEGVLLELLQEAAVTGQRCKWESQSKSVYHRQMLERDEIEVYMGAWQKQSLGDQVATVLTNPTVVSSSEPCSSLRGTVRAMTLGPYKQRKLRQARKKEVSKDKVAEEKFELRRRKQLVKIDKSYW